MTEERQLSAIMFTDIVGYTSLMGKDEKKGLEILDQKQHLIEPILDKFNGEKLKDIGDGTLSSFRSAVDAVNCAINIQRENLSNGNFSIRIGIHVGDVVFRDGDIFGDGVNVASRIEPLAEPGGICVSGSVYENIRNQTSIKSFYLGEKELKNVAEPIRVYALTAEGLPAPKISIAEADHPSWMHSRRYVFIALAVVSCGILYLLILNHQPAVEDNSKTSKPPVKNQQPSLDQDNSLKILQITKEDRQKNAEDITRLENELESLALKIDQMNNEVSATPNSEEIDITTASSLIEEKESKQKQLDGFKKKRKEVIANDIAAYEKIIQSTSGKDLQKTAWNKLVSNYPEAMELDSGDLIGIKMLLLKAWVEPTSGIEFLWIEGGCFQMGDTSEEGAEDEKPAHEVCLDSFGISKHEVTQGQWQKIMGSNPSKFTKGDDYPVEQVSWFDTQDFMRKFNSHAGNTFRLPTEAEWEYSACAGSLEQKYAGGNNIETLGWHNGNSQESTHPVGTKEPNDFGLFDMSGNVLEWCSDWYGGNYYQQSLRNNPSGPSSGSLRVIRDGCWNGSPWLSRCTNRDGFKPGYSLDNLGFRVVLSGK